MVAPLADIAYSYGEERAEITVKSPRELSHSTDAVMVASLTHCKSC